MTTTPPPAESAPSLDPSRGERIGRGAWMALTAALLGWMFDGLEMGLFPLVARPALAELLGITDDRQIGLWFGVATAGFLVGAATGGVLFGWLGDRIGRVRAMMLSVLTYSIFSGACGLATSAEQITVLRFLSALGMGGEWSLGVALVMEIWPNKSRALLAGLIGAAANVGYLLIAVLGLVLGKFLSQTATMLSAIGLPETWVGALTANSGWRLLMILGAVPALLTFFIRLFVPESERWQAERSKGGTSHWATRDLIGVLIGAGGAVAIIYLWAAADLHLALRIAGSLVALVVVTLGYLYPVGRYLARSQDAGEASAAPWWPTIGRMLLGAALSGVALLGTWASLQWAPTWADKLAVGLPNARDAKALTQIFASFGAIVGTVGAALLGNLLGRRLSYCVLCVGSLASALALFQLNTQFDGQFLLFIFLAGGFTAAFYGWLPLYLPELFGTRIRATGQGFSFNFGRIVAAIGALQGGYLMNVVFEGEYAEVCSIMSLIYLVGLAIIWLAPETRGKPLPE
jgi:SHS family sialic acid transporter-like MFS transporter